MISVVITCCQEDIHFLPRAIASVEWQLAEDDELIVVRDGVLDTSFFDLCVESNSRARHLRINERRGVSSARNYGWRDIRNQWVKFLDVDDLLCPFALEALRVVIPNTEADLIVGGQFIVHNGLLVGLRNADPAVLQQMKAANPFLVSYTAIRKSVLEKVGGFDERIHFEEDWDLWLKLHEAGARSAFIKAPLCFYTIDDERRAETEKRRSERGDHNVEGMDVREYFRRTYGVGAQP